MKYLPCIAGGLLGALFLFAGIAFFTMEPPKVELPANAVAFMTAMGGTGYLKAVKVLEILGGLLVAIPKTRNLGLLVLGPIILNILFVNYFLMGGMQAVLQPMVIAAVVLSLYLLWAERRAFGALINRPAVS